MAKEIFAKDPREFNVALAEALKKIPEIKAPEWSLYVKSGVSKERVPESPDFWYIRMASVLRQLYIRGVVGVGKLRTRYGSKQYRGERKPVHKKASGKMLRVMLQQAESVGIVEKLDKIQFGRRLTQQGRDFLDSIKVGEADGKKA